ncbi:hypothetical protein PROFUN_02622 [Planoprotostelium fungivorum]|uniref:Uncharacterized protein n=1 Tax=Planoprotostelium fungivorum TaxID=1890364 RepID=A0A2P6NV89_9EUKA|nr:hypothetical protein PROFUN_02622 [Planoprotostelium fungivorum]
MSDPLADLDDLLEELDRSGKPSTPSRVSIPPPMVDSRPVSQQIPRGVSNSFSTHLAADLPPPVFEHPAPIPEPVYAPAPVPVAAPKSTGEDPHISHLTLEGSDAWKNELDDLLSELSVSSNQAPAPAPAPAPTNSYVPRQPEPQPSYPAYQPSYQQSSAPPAPKIVQVSSAGYTGSNLPIEYSAGHSVTLTQDEQNLIHELNRARTNPSNYADVLERDRRPYFNGKHLKLPGTNVLLVTEEGVGAVDDAIAFLRAQRPLPPFKVSPGMVSAAKEAIAEVGPLGETSCESIRRFDKYGRFEQEAVEIASFGTSDAKEIVLRFIVCDGQPDRVQRTYIFEPIYSCVGFAVGEHKSAYRTMACINFTKAFNPNK